jgi:ornithine cyclodeaminase
LRTAVLGAGVQARFQLKAIARVRPIQRLRVWSPRAEELGPYEREMGAALGIAVQGAGSPEEAVKGADLIVTVTPARNPILELPWLAEGATILAVGSDGPEKQELDPDILAAAEKVVVDSRAQCLALGETHHAVEAGYLSPERIHAELGEVLLGIRPGREADELIVCDLTGLGAQDAALAAVVWESLRSGAP